MTGEDDDEFDGNQNYVITAAISGTDPAYTNLEDPVIGGLNLDDDAQILINPSEGLVTTESGATDSFEVALTLPPAPGIDNNVKVIFSNFDLSEGLLSVNELVFTSNNWLDPQTVTIFPQDDFEVDGDQDYTIVTTVESGDAKYDGLNVVDVQVMNLDDDNAIVVAPFDFLETTEAGGQAQFDVYLQAQPTEPVFVHLHSLDESEGVVNFEVLEFTSQSWGIESAQTVTVTGVDDQFDDGDIMYSIETTVITDDPFFNGYNPEDVQLTNLDDDEPNDLAGLAISPSSGLETTELGGLANYSVVLTSQPTGMVTVKSASLDSEEGIVTSGGSLQFTANNWNEPQIVTVTGQDDEFDDGDVAYAVSVSVESEDVQYNGMDVPQVQLTNIDDDEETAAGLAAIVLSKSSGIETSEDGQEDVVLVSLASSPGVDLVTVNFSIADVYSDEVAMPVSALEFDQFNWNVPIEVVIAGVDDLVVDGDVMYSINVNTTASNPASPYHNLAAQIAGVNSDNDRGVLVKPGYDGVLKTEENGDNKQFTMVMTAAPVNDVIVSVESQDLTEGVLDVSEVVFTPDNWSVIQAVNVTPQDDDVMDGNIFYNIKTTLSTTDPLINSGVVDVTVINDDDELVPGAPALVVNPSSGLVTYEAGITPDRFLVTLGTAPSAPVNVSVAVSDESEAEVNKQNFVLDNGNWDTGVWVIVNGLDDSSADGDQEYSIAVSTESSDSDYDQLVELVLGINIDDEMPTLPATLVLSNTESLTTTETGNVASFKVALNGMPSSDVIINVLTEDDSEGEVQTNQIIFNDNNWNVATDVFIAGLDDDEFDGDIVYAVRLIITSDDEAYAALDDTLVLLTNLDDENENAGVAGVVISQTSGLLTDEDGLTDQFDIRLASEPAGSVTMTLTSNNEAEGLVSPTEIEFNANNWNQSIPVTLTGQDDQAFDGNQDYTVSISVDSDDPNYDGLEVDDVKATNHDNEIANGPGVALTQHSLITSEDGGQLGSDQFEIFLTSQPISPVTITLVSSDENEAVVNPAIIELNGANWNVPTAITVTGVDDGDLVDGDAPYMISLTAESLDPDYDELAIDDIVGLNLDNDSPGNGCEEPSPMNDPDIIYKTGFECIVE